MRKRILLMTLPDLVPPDTIEDERAAADAPWKTDYDVTVGLRELEHEVFTLGIEEGLDRLDAEIAETRPHIVFNLMEQFAGHPRFVAYMLGHLELSGIAYTGCNPVGMMFSNNKALQRKILRHHRIPTPDFMIVPRGRAIRRPKRLTFPLIVKSLVEHGSAGIAQASVVSSDEKLAERVAYIHESIGTDAIVEDYIEGRELYLGMLGNERLETFPLWEMRIPELREGAPRIATQRLKWDSEYQERVGLTLGPAEDIDDAVRARVERTCRRAYKALEQSGYARFDLRLTPSGRAVVIESNPNPDLAYDAEFAEAAAAAGHDYPRLLQRILNLGLRWKARSS
jgi:D-alanine-D-alanine ligase